MSRTKTDMRTLGGKGDVTGRSEPVLREPDESNMRLSHHRGNQQWIVDYLVRETGRDRSFFYEERKLPAGVKSYAMIPRHMERVASHKERLAAQAEARGDVETARSLYYAAALDYFAAQHALPFDDHPEKIYLYGRLDACFDRVIAFSRNGVRRIEVPWNSVTLPGLFYPATVAVSDAPTLLHINGMDVPKEMLPHALDNPYTARGFNVVVVDGPGQGASTVRKTRVTPENFAPSMQTVLDFACDELQVDSGSIVVVGNSLGSFWGLQLAGADARVRALATSAAAYGPQYGTFQQAEPHYKRQHMYMTGVADEDEFDRLAARMFLTQDDLQKVRCPALFVVGEYDLICPLEESWRTYKSVSGPKEFWLLEDEGHSAQFRPGFGGLSGFQFMTDWLRRVLDKPLPDGHDHRVVVARESGLGPYGDHVNGFWMPERLG